jgi:hypothetical protein
MIKAILNLFKPKVKAATDNPEFKNFEWAFQFNEDEPVLLAKPNEGSKKLIIHVGIKKSSVLTFKDGKGNEFKIFARERIDNYTIGQKTI